MDNGFFNRALNYTVIYAKKYSEALEYLRIYIATMDIEDSLYYKNVKKYLILLQEQKDSEYIINRIDKNVIENFKKNKLVNAINYPLCPNCVECKLNKFCITKSKINTYKQIINEMANHSIKQEAFENLIYDF